MLQFSSPIQKCRYKLTWSIFSKLFWSFQFSDFAVLFESRRPYLNPVGPNRILLNTLRWGLSVAFCTQVSQGNRVYIWAIAILRQLYPCTATHSGYPYVNKSHLHLMSYEPFFSLMVFDFLGVPIRNVIMFSWNWIRAQNLVLQLNVFTFLKAFDFLGVPIRNVIMFSSKTKLFVRIQF